ncbi:MAG: PaaI family thioesterase [Lachnospiraceae bacterium]|nr:PaaI family thioesterase [Lachnospiraceae bacterium]
MTAVMKDTDAIKEKIYAKHGHDLYMRDMGLEILELREGYVKSRIPVKKEHLNSYGYVHGGVLYGFADVSAGLAASMCGYCVVTLEGSMHYLDPAEQTEYIYCEAEALREGKNMMFYHVRLTTDAGKAVDDGTFTFFNTHNPLPG